MNLWNANSIVNNSCRPRVTDEEKNIYFTRKQIVFFNLKEFSRHFRYANMFWLKWVFDNWVEFELQKWTKELNI